MAQPLSQDRQCTIAGSAYTLRFSTKALAALQDIWGEKSLDGVLTRINSQAGGLDVIAASDLLWASLRTHHQDVSLDDVLTMLDDAGAAGLATIMQHLNGALAAALPPPAEVAEARPTKAEGKARAA